LSGKGEEGRIIIIIIIMEKPKITEE